MREIKFRAWDGRRKALLPNVAVYHHALGNSVIVKPSAFEYAPEKNWHRDDYGFYYSDDNSVVPMQYTGLKDKNGVEIYEGDIMLTSKGNCPVKWKGGAWGFSNVMWNDRYEVVGNIYENSELLKGDSNGKV